MIRVLPTQFMELNTAKLARGGLVLLIAYVAYGAVCRAYSRPFWFDEVITVALAKQPTLGAVRSALENAADSHPPPFYGLERLAGHLPLNEHVAYRLPSILAFSCTVLCVFLFVRKARGSECALVCAAILLVSRLFNHYAVEARGYSLMTGFVALAMLGYQRANKIAWCIVIGLSLAAAEASHYYAVFAIIPLVLGEFAFLAKERRLRVGVWLAVLFGNLPLVMFWSLLQTCKQYYGTTFWSRPSLGEAMRFYGWLFKLPPEFGIGLAVAALAAILFFGFLRCRETFADNVNGIPVQEHVLVLGFLILPFVIYVTTRVLHGGFNIRYLLVSALGFPLAASYVLPALGRRLLALFAILLFASLGAQEAAFWRGEVHLFGRKVSPTGAVEKLVDAAGHNDLPVMVSNAIDYLQLAYYEPPSRNHRLVYAVDLAAANVYARSDSSDRCLLALKPYSKLHVYEFADFARDHDEFLVYSNNGSRFDWWPTRLVHDGYTLELVAIDEEKRMYLVRRER